MGGLTATFVAVLVLLSAAALRTASSVGREVGARRRVGPAQARPPVVPPPPLALAGALNRADLAVRAEAAWAAWLAAGAGVLAVAALVGGVGLALVAAGAWCGGPVLVLASLGRRAEARIDAAVPSALDAVARALRSGASLQQAMSEAALAAPSGLRAELLAVTTAAERGLPLVPALEEWAARRPSAEVRLTVAALCLGAETGGAQARAVDGVAATLRQRLAVAGEARSLSTQSRLSGLVIATSPLVFCALAAAADGRVATLLFRTPLGWSLLAAGLTFDAVGAAWMARLTRPQV